MIGRRITYSGRVQGVGFRYTATRLAFGLPVSGYVKNLPDGTVELWAEGDAAAVDEFLARIAAQMHGHVAQSVAEEVAPQSLSSFKVVS